MGNFFHCEPPLSQMLDDPLLQTLMASDGVDPRQLDALITETRERLARNNPGFLRPTARCRG